MRHELEEARELAKLELLVSLARSQRALTQVLEHAADQAAKLHVAEGAVLAELRAIRRHQQVLTACLTGRLLGSNRKSGTPAPPWLDGSVRNRSTVSHTL
jgi:hypothetical protein